jgi:hypothetical protein
MRMVWFGVEQEGKGGTPGGDISNLQGVWPPLRTEPQGEALRATWFPVYASTISFGSFASPIAATLGKYFPQKWKKP